MTIEKLLLLSYNSHGERVLNLVSGSKVISIIDNSLVSIQTSNALT